MMWMLLRREIGTMLSGLPWAGIVGICIRICLQTLNVLTQLFLCVQHQKNGAKLIAVHMRGNLSTVSYCIYLSYLCPVVLMPLSYGLPTQQATGIFCSTEKYNHETSSTFCMYVSLCWSDIIKLAPPDPKYRLNIRHLPLL